MNRELKGIHIYGCLCNERLKDKTKGSTSLTYTGLCGGLGHLKISTRLRVKRFESVSVLEGECQCFVSDEDGVLNEFEMMYQLRILFPLHFVVFKQTVCHKKKTKANVGRVFFFENNKMQGE